MTVSGAKTWTQMVAEGEMHKSGTAVEIIGVNKDYTTQHGDVVHALREINLTIQQHDFICVVGSSGCGKTTLLNMLAGFEKPSSGRILTNGMEIEGPSPSRGVVFQKPPLYPWLSVRRNVEFGMRMQGVSKTERRDRTDHFLSMVGLIDAADRKPYELSGGMQQRAQIARVLASDPEIILMDEPYGALDALTRENLQNELLRIWQERRKTIFFITHSVEEAVFLGSRVIVMSKHPGTIIRDVNVDVDKSLDSQGSTEKVRSNPEFIRLRDMITEDIYSQGM